MKKIEIFKAVDKLDGDLSVFSFLVVDGKDVCQQVHWVQDKDAEEVTEGVRNDMQAQGYFGFPDQQDYPRRADMIDPTLHAQWEVK